MREILPGLHHWTAFHERIRLDVSSYYAAGSRALIDPMLPADGIEALDELPEPQVFLLKTAITTATVTASRSASAARCAAGLGLHKFEGSRAGGGGVIVRRAGGARDHGARARRHLPDDTALNLEVGDGGAGVRRRPRDG